MTSLAGMRISVIGMGIAWMLLVAQALWAPTTDAARLGPFPATMLPATLGVVLLPAATVLGLLCGTGRYRRAMLEAALGTLFILFEIVLITTARPGIVRSGPSMNEIAVWLGVGLWLLASIEAILAIRQAPS